MSDCFATEFILSEVEGFIATTKDTYPLYADTLKFAPVCFNIDAFRKYVEINFYCSLLFFVNE